MSEPFIWGCFVIACAVMGILLIAVDCLERLALSKRHSSVEQLRLDYKRQPLRPVYRVNVKA